MITHDAASQIADLVESLGIQQAIDILSGAGRYTLMIGGTASSTPTVVASIGGDKHTASETAVYLASHLKAGHTVRLEGVDARLTIDSGNQPTGEHSGAGWGGLTMPDT